MTYRENKLGLMAQQQDRKEVNSQYQPCILGDGGRKFTGCCDVRWIKNGYSDNAFPEFGDGWYGKNMIAALACSFNFY